MPPTGKMLESGRGPLAMPSPEARAFVVVAVEHAMLVSAEKVDLRYCRIFHLFFSRNVSPTSVYYKYKQRLTH